jgi:hypothetical protein
MRGIIFTIGILLSIGSKAAFCECTPIPGANQIWSNHRIHWVFVGEVHGSNETPSAFFDLVCDAVKHGNIVRIALERPASEQQSLSDVLISEDLHSAVESLLDQPGWQKGVDGRASKAMLRLLLSLRELHSSHSDLSVSAFDTFAGPYSADSPGSRDEAMGHTLLALGKAHPDELILVLTGNLHAMQAPMSGYDLAAMYVPAEQRMCLEVTDTGTGESWVEWDGACGPANNGVREVGQISGRRIYLDPKLAPYGKVDGILSLGVPLTVSVPADEDQKPLPACRTKFLSEHSAGSVK